MKQIKVSEATPIQLDRLVAKCVGWRWRKCGGEHPIENYSPSTDWAQGGVILEREEIGFAKYGPNGTWKAVIGEIPRGIPCYGPTPLIAAMRCFCASRLGNEVDVPEELAALVKGE